MCGSTNLLKVIKYFAKLKLYWSILRPIVTYACEAWVLKETIKNKLIVLKNKKNQLDATCHFIVVFLIGSTIK